MPRPDARRSRHRAHGPAPVVPSIDDAAMNAALRHEGDLDSYLAALTPDSAHPTELTGRFGTAQVFQLRLPALRIEQLRRIAEDRGVTPGALAIDWVIERLDREDTATGPMPVLPATTEEPRRRGLLRRPR